MSGKCEVEINIHLEKNRGLLEVALVLPGALSLALL